MKKIRKEFFLAHFILGLVLIANSVAGQELPNLKMVTIKSDANFTDAIYSYSYTITNDMGNVGDIYGIDIDISKPKDGSDLSADGLINGPGFLEHTSALVLQETKVQMIPVGLSAPPQWVVGLGINGTVGWGGGERALLQPSESLSGFIITSRGIPGIRVFRVDPFVDVDALPDEILPPDDVEAAKQLTERLAFFGKTLGPTAPPADFKPLEFLDYIISIKHEAFRLGWIRNAGIEGSLDSKLDNAKKNLQRGNATSAKNILSAFVNEVEAQGCQTYSNCPEGKHLSPEAWALLRYNAGYLIDHL